jgi:hypothetical protein
VSSLRLAFVSAPGSSIFMAEILQAVGEAVSSAAPDLEVVHHRGRLEDVVTQGTAAVVVPHEYFAVCGDPGPEVRARTIALGVEHPGTGTFEVSTEHAARLGGWFEIAESSVRTLAARGHLAELFELGFVPGWDRWGGTDDDRPVDVTYLGSADPRRLAVLAAAAPALTGLRTDLLVPPHEPMTGSRPDFLVADDKWRHLARSKVIVNLHREEKAAFEVVRGLEAILNGCVIVTEPSSDLGPLVPGRHLLVAEPDQVGPVVRALVHHPERRTEIARAAYDLVRTELAMDPQASRLADVARRLAGAPAPAPGPDAASTPPTERPRSWAEAGAEPPMAEWVPAVPVAGPVTALTTVDADLAALRAARPSGVVGSFGGVCVVTDADGPAAMTAASWPAGPRLVVVRTDDPRDARGRGAARNAAVASLGVDHVAILDGGDEVLGETLAHLCGMLDADPDLDAVLCLASIGSEELANVLVPELRRLESRPYLSRGFVVRREVLEALGGFTEDDDLEDLVDHHFWLGLARAGGNVALSRHIGFRLWSREQDDA